MTETSCICCCRQGAHSWLQWPFEHHAAESNRANRWPPSSQASILSCLDYAERPESLRSCDWAQVFRSVPGPVWPRCVRVSVRRRAIDTMVGTYTSLKGDTTRAIVMNDARMCAPGGAWQTQGRGVHCFSGGSGRVARTRAARDERARSLAVEDADLQNARKPAGATLSHRACSKQ